MYGNGNNDKEIPPTCFETLYPGQPALIDGIEVHPYPVPHQTHEISLGLKVVYEGKKLLFSGDSAWTESFIDQARGVDLFLCECSFYDEQPGMHINYQVLRANLSRLECKQLVLTHLGEQMLARHGELPLKFAMDGLVVEF
jgi:ribonuclease BN (tRNA processing enzyme)